MSYVFTTARDVHVLAEKGTGPRLVLSQDRHTPDGIEIEGSKAELSAMVVRLAAAVNELPN